MEFLRNSWVFIRKFYTIFWRILRNSFRKSLPNVPLTIILKVSLPGIFLVINSIIIQLFIREFFLDLLGFWFRKIVQTFFLFACGNTFINSSRNSRDFTGILSEITPRILSKDPPGILPENFPKVLGNFFKKFPRIFPEVLWKSTGNSPECWLRKSSKSCIEIFCGCFFGNATISSFESSTKSWVFFSRFFEKVSPWFYFQKFLSQLFNSSFGNTPESSYGHSTKRFSMNSSRSSFEIFSKCCSRNSSVFFFRNFKSFSDIS